jgi:hypothetical protein
MLDRLEPAANQLAAFTGEARPVARDLHAAARPLADLLGDFGPLNDAARPTLVKLDQLSRTGRTAVRATKPVAAKLLPIARQLPPLAQITRDLNDSLKARGVPEGLLSFLYYGTAAVARFDRFSHILPSYQIAGTCQQYATTPVAGCDAHFGSEGGRQKAEGKKARRQVARRKHRVRRHAPSSTPPSAPLPSASLPSASPPPASPPSASPPSPSSVTDVLDFLLGK